MKKSTWLVGAGILAFQLLNACSGGDESAPGGASDSLSRAAASQDSNEVLKLPEPKVRRARALQLVGAQVERAHEVERAIAERYRGYRIVDTTETYHGDVVDWIDPKTVPGSEATPPPTLSAEQLRPPPGVEVGRAELEQYPELRGPKGTIPMHRPRYDAYVRGEVQARSLREYIQLEQIASRRALAARWATPTPNGEGQPSDGSNSGTANRIEPGQPSGQSRLYGGYLSYSLNTRVVGRINDFSGTVEAGTFSVIEQATVCRGSDPANTMELVGAATSRDRGNFSDSVLRVRVEYMAAGFAHMGDGIGGWDGRVSGFVPAANRPYGPGAAIAASTVNGAQYEHTFDILLSGGNWWISHNGNWLGYYPGSLFNLINTRGCEAHWYGEVFDGTPTSWTNTDMGSGLFASQGYGRAAWVRNPFYYDTANASHWPTPTTILPQDTRCYTITPFTTGAAPWDRYFYLGGPGGDAAGCD